MTGGLELDHLTVVAPSLEQGVEHVRDCLGLDVPRGGVHPEMGTHNHLLRIGDDIYLEIIAADPDGPPPAGPRWFGLGDPETVRAHWANGQRLRGWVARTDDIDAVLRRHGALLGGRTRVSRDGDFSNFSLRPDGEMPLGGVLPSVIERDGRSSPVSGMPDLGARLCEFVLKHPEPAEIGALFRKLGLRRAPALREGPEICFSALIETPGGRRTLL